MLADEKQKHIGRLNKDNVEAILGSHALWPFTSRMGWSIEQVNLLVESAKLELTDSSLKLYLPLLVPCHDCVMNTNMMKIPCVGQARLMAGPSS